MTNDDLDRLEQIAKAATPGPWEARGCRVESVGDPLGLIIYDEGGHNEADAAHIAAFNPQTALRLLAEVTRLAAERDTTVARYDSLFDRWVESRERHLAAEARLSSLTTQIEALVERALRELETARGKNLMARGIVLALQMELAALTKGPA